MSSRVSLVLSRNNWRDKKILFLLWWHSNNSKNTYSQFGQNHTATMRKHFIMLLIQKAQHSYTNRTFGQIKYFIWILSVHSTSQFNRGVFSGTSDVTFQVVWLWISTSGMGSGATEMVNEEEIVSFDISIDQICFCRFRFTL